MRIDGLPFRIASYFQMGRLFWAAERRIRTLIGSDVPLELPGKDDHYDSDDFTETMYSLPSVRIAAVKKPGEVERT
jgi:hypothetical protein